MQIKRAVCALLVLSFISTFVGAEMKYGQLQEEETVESLKQELRIAQYNAEKRNPDHAAFWCIIPGGGQVYNGQYLKAVVAYCAVLLSALAAWGNASYAGLAVAVWTYSAYDAHSTAKEYNKNLKKKYGLSSIQLLDTASLNSTL
ncbi:MAG: DUF5683 domain-containing protein [Candidatus Margulisiibacteriota bacterium]